MQDRHHDAADAETSTVAVRPGEDVHAIVEFGTGAAGVGPATGIDSGDYFPPPASDGNAVEDEAVSDGKQG
jgi:hypothetical protein